MALLCCVVLAACNQSSATVTATATPTPATQVSPARAQTSLTYDSGIGKVVLFGGLAFTSFTTLRDTWLWDGHFWRHILTTDAPPGNQQVTLVNDTTESAVLDFTATMGSAAAVQTWVFDGSWNLRDTTSVLPMGMLIADDPIGKDVIAFGGVIGFSPTNGDLYGTQTWSWNGQQWRQLYPATSPTASDANFGVMTTDNATGQPVLVNQRTGVVWTWNGATWAQHIPAQAPPARAQSALVYNGHDQAVVLLGGVTAVEAQLMSDMWAWNGVSWNQLAASVPSGIGILAAAWDPSTQTDVLYRAQGMDNGPFTSQTWLWNGTAWSQVP